MISLQRIRLWHDAASRHWSLACPACGQTLLLRYQQVTLFPDGRRSVGPLVECAPGCGARFGVLREFVDWR